jgi:hypothetical protein
LEDVGLEDRPPPEETAEFVLASQPEDASPGPISPPGPSWSARTCAPTGWWRVFNEPNLLIYDEPTVRDVDYPNIGIRRAQNDMTRGILEIETMAAIPSRRGDLSSFTIHRVPNPADVSVTVDNVDYTRWRVSGADSIEMEVDINDHQIRVAFAGGSGEVV